MAEVLTGTTQDCCSQAFSPSLLLALLPAEAQSEIPCLDVLGTALRSGAEYEFTSSPRLRRSPAPFFFFALGAGILASPLYPQPLYSPTHPHFLLGHR